MHLAGSAFAGAAAGGWPLAAQGAPRPRAAADPSNPGPLSALPACPAVFVQLAAPAELHNQWLSLLGLGLLFFGAGLQFVNKALSSGLLPVVLYSPTAISLLQTQLAFSLSPNAGSAGAQSSL